VTLTVRWIPLVTAAYGTRVTWPARTTWLPPDGHGSQLGPRIAYRKLGNYVRFHPDDLAEYVAANRVEAGAVAVGRRR
jgi:hypothetical protein